MQVLSPEGNPDQSLIVSQPQRWGKVGDYYSGYLYKLELIVPLPGPAFHIGKSYISLVLP